MVLLMGNAGEMQGRLVRDGVRFDFEVKWLCDIDPNRVLLSSQNPYDQVLGLLCVGEVYDHEWRDVFRNIELTQQYDLECARDTFALLVTVATLLPAPDWFNDEAEDMEMIIDISDSPILRRLAEDHVRMGALRLMRRAIGYQGHEVTEDDEQYLSMMSIEDLEAIDQRLRAGVLWPDIRGYLPGTGLGDD